MANTKQPQGSPMPHLLSLDNRSTLRVSGVTEVESFDEQAAVLHTCCGVLVVHGQGLHMQTLSIDGGQVAVDGRIDALRYEEPAKSRGWFGRLFG